MWFMLLAVGSTFFWTLLVIEFILLTWFVEEEWAAASFFSVLIFVVGIHLFGDASLPAFVKMNTKVFFTGVFIYAAAGVVWSLAKFYFYTSRLKRKINELKPEYAQYLMRWNSAAEEGKNSPRETSPTSWKRFVEDELGYESKKDLDFSNYTTRIIFWLAYWPVSMFWTVLNDPIRRAATWVYETVLIGIYRKIHQVTIGKALEY